MPRSRLQTALAFLGQRERPWFLLASLGVNLPLFWLLASVARSGPAPGSEIIIPVSTVEVIPEAEPPPPPPEPVAETPSDVEPTQADPPPAAEETPTPAPAPQIRSPVTARPGETADAAPSPSGETEGPVLDLPVISEQEVKAADALRAFQCNRLGAGRPSWCDEQPTEMLAMPDPAREPDMAPKRWADFEMPRINPAIRRIWAEGCPPKDGVINDAFTQDTTYYRQGAHAGVGSLSKNSVNKRCP
ncbi:hypothetical protein [Henriciella sp.]|uniref:hypothetical protein n=1 Tax=Henriciella sp. TaxID=1968823 RepID=UPI002638C197|nr:hypothetical protein [Henriciella sp.]